MNNTTPKTQFQTILEAVRNFNEAKSLATNIPNFGKNLGKKYSDARKNPKKYSKAEAIKYFGQGFDGTPVLLWVDADKENGPQWLNDVTGELVFAKETTNPAGVKTYKSESLPEAYDKNQMAKLSTEWAKLKKEIDSITEKYGVKKGQILMVSQLNNLKKKMTPEDLKRYEKLADDIKKNMSDTSKLNNSPPPQEKYPLGGRDEKSGRSYSN